MSTLLVTALVLIFTFQSAFANLFAKHYPEDKSRSSAVYSVFYGLIVALVTLGISGFDFSPTKWTIILGIINGGVLFGYNFALIKASQHGPFSVTVIFSLSGAILIPLFWSVLHDGVRFSLLQYIFVFILLMAFVFLNLEDKTEGENAKVSLKFFLYATMLFAANGTYGTILNTQKLIVGGSEDAELIVITFATSALLAFVSLIFQAGKGTLESFRQNKKSILSVLAASASAASAANLLMYCLGIINVVILYSIQNGGILIVSVLWSVIILKEKLGVKKIIGLILSIVAVFGLSIF